MHSIRRSRSVTDPPEPRSRAVEKRQEWIGVNARAVIVLNANTRINFMDTSAGSFPTEDWQLVPSLGQ